MPKPFPLTFLPPSPYTLSHTHIRTHRDAHGE